MADVKSSLIKTTKVIYFGDDDPFWDGLTDRYKEDYSNIQWEFLNFKEDPDSHVQYRFKEVLDLSPIIIYLDFSCFSDKLHVVAELLSRDYNFESVAICGFVESKEEIIKYAAVGLDFIFVKGAEQHDYIFDPMAVAKPGIVKLPQYATARCEESVNLYSFGKIGFITASYVHFESDFPIEKGDKVFLRNTIPDNIVPSKSFTVKSAQDFDLHYPFDYCYDLEFDYVDKPTFEDPVEEDGELTDPAAMAKQLEAERVRREEQIENFDYKIKETRKKVKEWVWDRIDDAKEKKLKILIFDKTMRLLDEEGLKPIDEYPYSIRCTTKFSNDFTEIDKIRPGIIALQLLSDFSASDEKYLTSLIEKYKDGTLYDDMVRSGKKLNDVEMIIDRIKKKLPQCEQDDSAMIESLIQKIKSIDNYNPIIILLSCHLQSASALQQTHQYPMIMAHESPMSTTIIESMATMFEKKQKEKYELLMTKKLDQLKAKSPKKYQKFTINDLKEKRFYVSKNNMISNAKIGIPIVIVRLNESEVRITCDRVIKLGSFYVEEPFQMMVTLVPIEKGKPYIKERNSYFYRGLINGISEEDKKNLRRYVNEIFFAPMQAEREKEQEEYLKLTELKMQEKSETTNKEATKSDDPELEEAPGIIEEETDESNSAESSGADQVDDDLDEAS